MQSKSLLLALALLLCAGAADAATNCNPCVYVSNQRSTSVSVIDGATNKVIANIPAGQIPQGLAVNPAGTRLYVSTHGTAQVGLVTVIDTVNYKIVTNIKVGTNPTGLAVNPAGTRLFVLNSGDNTLSVIDTSNNTVIGQPAPVVKVPYEVVVSPDGTKLYISGIIAGAVQVLNTTTLQQVGALIPIGAGPSGLALNAAGTRLYVADFVNNNVRIVNTTNATIAGTAPAGPGAIAVALGPKDKHLYVANFGGGNGNTVSVVDTANNASVATVVVGKSPHGLAVNKENTALYVANQQTSDVSVINPANNQVVAKVPVDGSPLGVAVVYADQTNPPPHQTHILSAVNGAPQFNPGATTSVALGQLVQFTVRVPNAAVGVPAEVHYYLNPNLQFVNASSGLQLTGICAVATLPRPNGVQGEAQLLQCTLPDGSKPLIVTAKVAATEAPRDDPYAAVACLPPAFATCSPARVKVTFTPAPFAAVGPQKTAIVLASAPNAGPHLYGDKQAVASVFFASANPKSAQSFLKQASFGLMQIAGSNPNSDGTAADIYGPVVTPSASCSFDAVALADSLIDYTKYDRLVVLVNNEDCGGGGLSVTKPVTFQTGEGQRQLTYATLYGQGFGDATPLGKIGNTAIHEYGHTLGMSHAGAWLCFGAVNAANGCFANSLWAPIDMVSQGSKYAHPNSVHKQKVGWLEGGRILPVWTTGDYSINAFEEATENVKVLKIPRKWSAAGSPLGYYYLSYSQPQPPWDTEWLASAPNFATGVAIHMDEKGMALETALLNATPGSIAGFKDITDGALVPGQTFTDGLAGVTISVTGVTATAAQVHVTIQPPAQRYIQLGVAPDTLLNVLGPDAGSVTGGGPHAASQAVTITATPMPGWKFVDWFDYNTNTIVSSANPFNLVQGDDRVLWARFGGTPPPNDNFANAALVAMLPLQTNVFTVGATGEVGETYPSAICNLGSAYGHTIWYEYMPAQNGTISVSSPSIDSATNIAVYTGNTLANLQPAVPGGCSVWTHTQDASVTFNVVAGTTYWIQFDNAGGTTGVDIKQGP
jgi:YVTN family beta-propeller protein